MVFYYGVFVAYDVFMVETFEYIDFFLYCFDELFADGHFFHRYKDAVVEVDAFVDFAIGSLAYLFDDLIALNGLVFGKIIHLSIQNNK